MRLVLPLALLLACAHSPPPPPGPRALSGTNTISKDAATLEIRVGYVARPDHKIDLVIDLAGTGTGTVGPIDLEIKTDRFDLEGAATWNGEVAAGAKQQHTVVLRPQTDGVGWLKVRWRRGDGEGAVFAPFLIGPDEIRPCQAADEACKDVRDPDPP